MNSQLLWNPFTVEPLYCGTPLLWNHWDPINCTDFRGVLNPLYIIVTIGSLHI